jgi:hypothetical protein
MTFTQRKKKKKNHMVYLLPKQIKNHMISNLVIIMLFN